MSKGFVVKVNDQWVKRTSKFGPFYGSMVLTNNRKEARVWTRYDDAKKMVSTIRFRCNAYPKDEKKAGKTPTVVVVEEGDCE